MHLFAARKDMRVPGDQLGDQVGGDRVNVETTGLLLRDPGVEEHLQQDVTKLFADCRKVVVFQRLVQLVGLLDEVGHQRAVGLLGVPGAATRRTQPVHHCSRIQQGGPGRFRGRQHRGTGGDPAGRGAGTGVHGEQQSVHCIAHGRRPAQPGQVGGYVGIGVQWRPATQQAHGRRREHRAEPMRQRDDDRRAHARGTASSGASKPPVSFSSDTT